MHVATTLTVGPTLLEGMENQSYSKWHECIEWLKWEFVWSVLYYLWICSAAALLCILKKNF